LLGAVSLRARVSPQCVSRFPLSCAAGRHVFHCDMDVRGVIDAKKRQARRQILYVVLLMVATLPLVWFLREDIWTWDGFPFGWTLASLVQTIQQTWMAREVARRARELEEEAGALALTRSTADARVYEGMGRHGAVRVWVPDDPRPFGRHGVQKQALNLFLLAAWFGTAAWLGVAGIAVALVVAAVWCALTARAAVEIEGTDGIGRRRRTRVYRVADVKVALWTLPAVAPEPERFPLVPGAAIPQLLARVRSMDEDEAVLDALVELGNIGEPGTLRPLLESLRKRRGPLPPRLIAVAEWATKRIRERHGLAESGALELSDSESEAGRLAVTHHAGSVSEPDDDR
jgi:hypothetical protein